MRTGIYTRISEDREAEGLGVKRQLEDCEQLAANRGWDVIDRYSDNDISAYSGKRRPKYRRMLKDIESGTVDSVVVLAPGPARPPAARARRILRHLRPGRRDRARQRER